MINTTQLVVETDKTTIEWLESQDYSNPQILPNNYTFPVFVVNLPTKEFFGTNATCMAAACMTGHKPTVLNFEQLKARLLQ